MKGGSLVYKRGQFVTYHCQKAFQEGSACIDAVCSLCKQEEGNEGHSCNICKQSIKDYLIMDDQSFMPRKRPDWPGPGPEFCGICEVRL